MTLRLRCKKYSRDTAHTFNSGYIISTQWERRPHPFSVRMIWNYSTVLFALSAFICGRRAAQCATILYVKATPVYPNSGHPTNFVIHMKNKLHLGASCLTQVHFMSQLTQICWHFELCPVFQRYLAARPCIKLFFFVFWFPVKNWNEIHLSNAFKNIFYFVNFVDNDLQICLSNISLKNRMY